VHIWQGFEAVIVLNYESKFHHYTITFCTAFYNIKSTTNSKSDQGKRWRSFILNNGSKAFTARLNNVDAPELKQNAGLNSYLYLNNKIIGKVLDYDSTGKDLYGRTLISAKLEGKRLDSMLIRDGWAWHYVNYSKDAMLDTAMKQAAFNGLGLWACGIAKVCPPWLWRKYSIKNQMKYCKGCKSNF
jgi:micrococcal nuclease